MIQLIQKKRERKNTMRMSKLTKIAIANYFPVLISCVFFRVGWIISLMLSPFLILLIFVNYIISGNVKSLILLSVNLLISTIVANCADTLLYYTFVSSDAMTLLVGFYLALFSAIFVIIGSLISVIIKIISI